MKEGALATIIALTVITFAIKAAGPVLLGGRELPVRVLAVVGLFASALLGALVMVETFGGEEENLVLDARVLGVGAAALALWRRASLLVAVVLAASVTAGVRAVA